MGTGLIKEFGYRNRNESTVCFVPQSHGILETVSGVVKTQVDRSHFASGNVWLCGKFLEYCAGGGTGVEGDFQRVYRIMRRCLQYSAYEK